MSLHTGVHCTHWCPVPRERGGAGGLLGLLECALRRVRCFSQSRGQGALPSAWRGERPGFAVARRPTGDP
eukprot:8410854-Lingulodinium_polyedra.AAC.1